MHKVLIGFIFCVGFFSCTHPSSEVVITIQGAAGKKIYLIKVPYLDEKDVILDSAIVIDLNHPIHFPINEREERILAIKVPGSGAKYQFINDGKQVKLTINHINSKYSVTGSEASISLKNFIDDQRLLADSLRKLALHIKQGTIDSDAKKKYEQVYKRFMNNYIYYADTVKSAAGFMAVLNVVDFGTDYVGQTAFITKNAKRFQYYQPIQQVKAETLDMIKIYEEELQIGDSIPTIELPSGNNTNFSTASLAGSYYLLDIWSTWCPQCRIYNYYKKKLYEKYAGKNFSIVSISFDDEIETWKRVVTKDSLDWTQLIDEKMWRGTAANTLKFDSIPFNYLVDPQGRIVAKGIKADSLPVIIAKYVK